jgi:uncharacterized protein
MPIIEKSTYKPNLLFRFNHLNTVAPTFFRKIKEVNYQRKRLTTPDKDFVDIDISSVGSKTALLLLHGLEGHSDRAYVRGPVREANRNGWDAVAMNFRGCSGEPNLAYKSYHMGLTEDVEVVVDYLIKQLKYTQLFLMGFSLGGNVTLKYIGERGSSIRPEIKGAVAVSVPCDLMASSKKIDEPSNIMYMKRFVRSLKKKAAQKIDMHPNCGLKYEELEKVSNFYGFDNLYTAPSFGYKDAVDYWQKNASKQFMPNIQIPVLLINALDDPFLTPECYPYKEARENPNLFFETPKHGGHVGFATNRKFSEPFWHELRAFEFLKNYVKQ